MIDYNFLVQEEILDKTKFLICKAIVLFIKKGCPGYTKEQIPNVEACLSNRKLPGIYWFRDGPWPKPLRDYLLAYYLKHALDFSRCGLEYMALYSIKLFWTLADWFSIGERDGDT